MSSEKELFVTKQYVPTGQPISRNDHTIIYRVKCLVEPGKPEAILKMYRNRNVKNMYEILKKLDYSEWPHVYAVKYFDDSTLVVEEALKGRTLAECLDQNREQSTTFSEAEAYRIMDEVCRMIEFLAGLEPPIIHSNLKPSNIFITTTGHVKFLDFESPKTHKGHSVSSILHLLGSIFHEMMTGKKPSGGKCSYVGRFEPTIKKCLEKNPQKQYQSVREFQDDIEVASTQEYTGESSVVVKMPYTLTMPFQGIILGFEWILFSYFMEKDSASTASFFGIIFGVHLLIYILKRRSFFKTNSLVFQAKQRILPFVLLALSLGILSLLLYWFILPMT